MREWKVLVIDEQDYCKNSPICSLVVKALDEFFAKATRGGKAPPLEVYVEVGEPVYRVEIAKSLGGAVPQSKPESCLLYAGWSGVPEVYIRPSNCKRYDNSRVVSEAYRVAAHIILHRGYEYYVVELGDRSALEELPGELAIEFLYLVSAGVRAYEALEYAGNVVGEEKVAYHVRLSLTESIDYYEELVHQLELEKHVLWLLTAEFFKLVAEALPFIRLPEISHCIDELEAILANISRSAWEAVWEGAQQLPELTGLKTRLKVGFIATRIAGKLKGNLF
ncbi:MAG TPA: hypothetical protein EYH17_02150 [Pyrodictium sp.]|nr:hypothetical protein [Pyrodictium sp.]